MFKLINLPNPEKWDLNFETDEQGEWFLDVVKNYPKGWKKNEKSRCLYINDEDMDLSIFIHNFITNIRIYVRTFYTVKQHLNSEEWENDGYSDGILLSIPDLEVDRLNEFTDVDRFWEKLSR